MLTVKLKTGAGSTRPSADLPPILRRSRKFSPPTDKPVAVSPAPTPITVRVKRLPSGAGLPLPTRMTQGAAGFDLTAAVSVNAVLQPGQIQVVPCGFALALPPGYEAQVRPRSGLASRHGITLVNTPGTIDADYRGEVQVPLINLGRSNFVVERGMRVAQMIVVPVPDVTLVEVTDLDSTNRGTGGFGHTGH